MGGGGKEEWMQLTWESETCFSLLEDERLKSLIDLSIFKCTSAPVCALVCVYADALEQRLFICVQSVLERGNAG